jgi:CheY-like chemotaxis protein
MSIALADRHGIRMAQDGTEAAEDRIRDRRVLLVEDEMMVAMLVEDMLADFGCHVVGPVGRIDEALAAAGAGGVDIAILDVNLNGKETYPVADALTAKGIPFVFATGYGAGGLREAYKAHPTLQKPFQQRDLVRVLASALDL